MTFETAVGQLVEAGFSRAAAEAQVRAQLPNLAPPPAPAKDETVLEKAEQLEIRRIATAYGFNVWVLSQPRATKQTPGLADLFLTHRSAAIAFWWETKRQVGGALSPAQEDFRDACQRTNTGHSFGDPYAFVDKLIALELAVRGAGHITLPSVHAAKEACPRCGGPYTQNKTKRVCRACINARRAPSTPSNQEQQQCA